MWEPAAPAGTPVARLTDSPFTGQGLVHTVRNDLTLAVGEIGLALADPSLPPALEERLLRAETALMVAGYHLTQFHQLTVPR